MWVELTRWLWSTKAKIRIILRFNSPFKKMSGRARGSHIWLTLREMRIAKMDKKVHIKPCTGEVSDALFVLSYVPWHLFLLITLLFSFSTQFENFLRSQALVGAENDVPYDIAQALSDCMEAAVSLDWAWCCFVLLRSIAEICLHHFPQENAPRPIHMKSHLKKFLKYEK